MTERWRKPVRFAVAGQTEKVTRDGDRLFHEPELSVSPETWERIRTGYVCPRCLEPHERAFPQACVVCSLARNVQQQMIDRMFKGALPASESYEDEEARLQEENERRMHRPGSSIVLPSGVRLDS